MKKITGLSSHEVERQRKAYGSNLLQKEKTKGVIRRFFENLGDPIIKILLIAASLEIILSFGNCNYFEVFGIIIAVLIATVVSTVFEYGSEAAFKKLEQDSMNATAEVLRDGVRQKIFAGELVVGDIVFIKAGDVVEADGRIISGKVLVNQSALNGEGREACKRAGAIDGGWELDSESAVFRGSAVTEGEAVIEVGRVGE